MNRYRNKKRKRRRRRCSKCGRIRNCRANRTCKHGLQMLCLPCQRAYFREWYALNRERKLEYQRQYDERIRNAKESSA